jgi:hypothetical protein
LTETEDCGQRQPTTELDSWMRTGIVGFVSDRQNSRRLIRVHYAFEFDGISTLNRYDNFLTYGEVCDRLGSFVLFQLLDNGCGN